MVATGVGKLTLVGRADVHEQLSTIIDAARRGQGGVVLPPPRTVRRDDGDAVGGQIGRHVPHVLLHPAHAGREVVRDDERPGHVHGARMLAERCR